MGKKEILYNPDELLDIYEELQDIVNEFTTIVLPASQQLAKTNFYVNGKAKDAVKALEKVTDKTNEIITHYGRAASLVTGTIEKVLETDQKMAEAISRRYSGS